MKILYLTRLAPYPTESGGQQRSALIYEALCTVGEVDTVVLAKREQLGEEAIAVLEREYSLKVVIPLTPVVRNCFLGRLNVVHPKLVYRLLRNFDGSRSIYAPDLSAIAQLGESVELSRYDMVVGRYLHSLANTGFPQGRYGSILDIDDLDSDVYASRSACSSGAIAWLYRYHERNIRARETELLRKPDFCWVANPESLSVAGPRKISVLPNIPYLLPEPVALPFPEGVERSILFLASFKHRPNRDGARWFFRKVWPAVAAAHPDARLKVYGLGLNGALKREFAAHVEVQAIGYVDDVQDAYRESLLSVCPVISGAGTNVKVLESFSLGRVCVLSAVASRGIRNYSEFRGHLDVGANATEMSRILIHYLRKPQEAKIKGAEMKSIMQNSANKEDFNQRVRETALSLVQNAKASQCSRHPRSEF